MAFFILSVKGGFASRTYILFIIKYIRKVFYSQKTYYNVKNTKKYTYFNIKVSRNFQDKIKKTCDKILVLYGLILPNYSKWISLLSLFIACNIFFREIIPI